MHDPILPLLSLRHASKKIKHGASHLLRIWPPSTPPSRPSAQPRPPSRHARRSTNMTPVVAGVHVVLLEPP